MRLSTYLYTLKLTKCKCEDVSLQEGTNIASLPADHFSTGCLQQTTLAGARSQTKNAANSFVRRVNRGPETRKEVVAMYFIYLTGSTTESHESSAIPRTTGELQVSTNYIRMFLFDRPVIYQAGRLGRGRSHSRGEKILLYYSLHVAVLLRGAICTGGASVAVNLCWSREPCKWPPHNIQISNKATLG